MTSGYDRRVRRDGGLMLGPRDSEDAPGPLRALSSHQLPELPREHLTQVSEVEDLPLRLHPGHVRVLRGDAVIPPQLGQLGGDVLPAYPEPHRDALLRHRVRTDDLVLESRAT